MNATPFVSKCAALASKQYRMNAVRNISIGTDMISSVISLQKARPWYQTAEEGSNLATENAIPLKELFKKKTVAFFGVPAPFTGTCTLEHYPGYKELADEILQNGCDEIVCYAVSDPYAHFGWAEALGNDPNKITFLADPDCTFARAYGVDTRYDDTSLGERSIRFSMVVENGQVVTFKKVDNAREDARTVLESLKIMKDEASVA